MGLFAGGGNWGGEKIRLPQKGRINEWRVYRGMQQISKLSVQTCLTTISGEIYVYLWLFTVSIKICRFNNNKHSFNWGFIYVSIAIILLIHRSYLFQRSKQMLLWGEIALFWLVNYKTQVLGIYKYIAK